MTITNDDNCQGCCRCPQCGVTAYWSFHELMHACADPECAHQFREHDEEQFADDDDPILDQSGRIVAPAQHAPAPRPDGPWRNNRNNTTGE